MSEHQGHRSRLRRQFLQHGLEPYPDYQALELLLCYAIPRQDTQPIARALLKRFGSLQGVFCADEHELMQVPGIGENAAVLLRLVPEICRRSRISAQQEKGSSIRSKEDAGDYFLELLNGKSEEEFYCMCLDAKGKILSCRCIAKGSSNALSVNVRKVVEEVVHTGAVSVILSHNHPSGVALPSQADNSTTLEIFRALRSIHVQLLDHIIVADGDYVSLAANGLFC